MTRARSAGKRSVRGEERGEPGAEKNKEAVHSAMHEEKQVARKLENNMNAVPLPDRYVEHTMITDRGGSWMIICRAHPLWVLPQRRPASTSSLILASLRHGVPAPSSSRGQSSAMSLPLPRSCSVLAPSDSWHRSTAPTQSNDAGSSRQTATRSLKIFGDVNEKGGIIRGLEDTPGTLQTLLHF